MGSIHYLQRSPDMHTTDWPARRVTEQCESAAGCACLVTGIKRCGCPQACELPDDEPTTNGQACAPAVGVLVGSTLGALALCLAVWAWRSL